MRSRARSAKVALTLVASILFVGFVLVRVVQVQAGYRTPTDLVEPWVTDIVRVREQLYAQTPARPGKTIWVVSGSSGLFGIASEAIALATDYDVRNYSLHAALSLETLFSQVKDKVQPGDLVVAPIEWEVYNNPFATEYESTAFIDHFQRYIPLSFDLLYRMYTSVSLRRWADGLVAYLTAPAGAKPYFEQNTDAGLLAQWQARQAAPVALPTQAQIYTSAALTANGDLNVRASLGRDQWVADQTFHTGPIGPVGLGVIRKWTAYFESRGARLVLVPPQLSDARTRELAEPDTWARIEGIRGQLERNNTPLYCDPMSMVLSAIYRTDTNYHINVFGARLRSAALGNCLAQMLAGEDVKARPIDPAAAAVTAKLRLAQQLQDYGVGDLPVQTRLRDLAAMNQAILAYHAQFNAYPPSDKGNLWGMPQGLAPQFLPNLPADPAGKAVAGYSYWSNGLGYKLVDFGSPDDCTFVSAYWPELIDMSRTTDGDPTLCQAYGYWSPGADSV